MDKIIAAFPQRPMRILKSGVQPAKGHIIFALVLFALLIGGAIWVGPNLMRDFIIQVDPVEVPEADIANGECSTYRGILTDCGADISYEIKGKLVEASLHSLFIDPFHGDYEVSVIRSSSHATMATLSLGLDMLWNRAIVAALIGFGLLIGGIALLRKAGNTAKFNRMVQDSVQLVPIAATVNLAGKVMFGLMGSSYQVKYSVDGKKTATAHVGFSRHERPFLLGKSGKQDVFLGAIPRQGGMLIVLDAALERVDFTDAERAALSDAINAMD